MPYDDWITGEKEGQQEVHEENFKRPQDKQSSKVQQKSGKYGRNVQKTAREKQLGYLRLMVSSQILSTARIFSCSAAQQPERIRGKTYFASVRRPQRH